MRVRAEFFDRSSVYMQGVLSLEEALSAFRNISIRVSKMEVYKEGKRETIWTTEYGWVT